MIPKLGDKFISIYYKLNSLCYPIIAMQKILNCVLGTILLLWEDTTIKAVD